MSVAIEANRTVSPAEAAGILGVKENTLAQWRSSGKYGLRFIRVGGKLIRYRLADLEAFLEQGAQGGESK